MTRDDPSHTAPVETRLRIVHAVADLVTEEHPAAISVPAVARRAGVSVATVYRYFPTKSLLLDAAAEVGSEHTMASVVGRTITDDAIDELIARSFWELADHLPLVRNQQRSDVGRDLRKRRRPMKREMLVGSVVERGLDPDDPSTVRLLTLVELLASSASLLELHDQLDVPIDDAAAAYVTWAVRVLMGATEHDQRHRDGATTATRRRS